MILYVYCLYDDPHLTIWEILVLLRAMAAMPFLGVSSCWHPHGDKDTPRTGISASKCHQKWLLKMDITGKTHINIRKNAV